MTTRSYAFGLAALICLGVIFSASSPAAENDANSPVSDPNAAIKSMPKIIVMVNGIDITQQQVDVEIAPQLEQMVKQLPAQFVEQYKKQLEAQVVDKMVVELLLDEK
ncbi:MAG: SurA N-terminal domain-containing protein, partial [Planctomycetes bacterium]|nr:SurA N-terminal domain-containing protein [Planctomycetota bacterium]